MPNVGPQGRSCWHWELELVLANHSSPFKWKAILEATSNAIVKAKYEEFKDKKGDKAIKALCNAHHHWRKRQCRPYSIPGGPVVAHTALIYPQLSLRYWAETCKAFMAEAKAFASRRTAPMASLNKACCMGGAHAPTV